MERKKGIKWRRDIISRKDETKKGKKGEREEGPCIYGTLCAELPNGGIRLACEVHRGETSSHTLKQKLKGCLEAHSTRRGTIKDTLRPAASTHTNLIPFMFLSFHIFFQKMKTILLWWEWECFSCTKMWHVWHFAFQTANYIVWDAPCSGVLMVVVCLGIPIMLLRDRSWIFFWFGPSGAPQNDTGE